MAYIPSGAEWYIAELVEEITVQGESDNVVHINLVLVNARSPEQAYSKALELGRDGEDSYMNPAGATVNIKFQGLRDLNVLHEGLSDGAEILFEERIGLSQDSLKSLLRPKEDLSVFSESKASGGPDYSSKDIVDEANALMDERSK
jgi:hypothetical protein